MNDRHGGTRGEHGIRSVNVRRRHIRMRRGHAATPRCLPLLPNRSTAKTLRPFFRTCRCGPSRGSGCGTATRSGRLGGLTRGWTRGGPDSPRLEERRGALRLAERPDVLRHWSRFATDFGSPVHLGTRRHPLAALPAKRASACGRGADEMSAVPRDESVLVRLVAVLVAQRFSGTRCSVRMRSAAKRRRFSVFCLTLRRSTSLSGTRCSPNACLVKLVRPARQTACTGNQVEHRHGPTALRRATYGAASRRGLARAGYSVASSRSANGDSDVGRTSFDRQRSDHTGTLPCRRHTTDRFPPSDIGLRSNLRSNNPEKPDSRTDCRPADQDRGRNPEYRQSRVAARRAM